MDFPLNKPKKENKDKSLETMEMTVSPVCEKDGKRFAFVSFKNENYYAEGKIPECKIVRNNGFDEGEVLLLEDYMKRNLTSLKKTAAKLNPFEAMRR